MSRKRTDTQGSKPGRDNEEENLPEVGSEHNLDEFELDSEESEPGDRRRDPLRRAE